MIRILAPHPNITMPTMARILCILHPTRVHPVWEMAIAGAPIGEFDHRRLSWMRRAAIWRSHRVFQRANVRSARYVLDAAQKFVQEHAPNAEVDLLVDPHYTSQDIDAMQGRAGHIFWCDSIRHKLPLRGGLLAELRGRRYDTLVMLYPDAIGLGWERLENQLKELGVPTTIVLNGRHRAFFWDRTSQRAIRLRRFLEKAWIAETFFTLIILLVSVPLALFDVLKLRAGRPGEGTKQHE